MDRRTFLSGVVGGAAAVASHTSAAPGRKASPTQEQTPMGPLRVHPDNPRYFTDGSGKAVLLVGSHTWNSLVDISPSDPPTKFDFDAYLDFLAVHGHNFIRLWTWEPVTWDTTPNRRWGGQRRHNAVPQPWARTGKAKALDGRPKFDLTKYSAEYFKRLRTRVEAARRRGIYVSVMLFEGWAMQFSPGAWEGHPFHPKNNINGIDADTNGDGKGLEFHELGNKAVLNLQAAYVRKAVDTVNDLDNVLWEISNENHAASTKWQYHMIELIHAYEKTQPHQHPVGMTFQYKGGSNQALFDSPAEWISPNPVGGYRDNPPASTGRKVIITDTDHLWGIGGTREWVWMSFFRGMNPIFMDPYDGLVLGTRFDKKWASIHRAMGQVLRLSRRIDLAGLKPQDKLASTGYCLAKATRRGAEYLVYAPKGGRVTVDLSATPGELAVEWYNPRSDKTSAAGKIKGGGRRQLTPPFQGDAVLLLVGAE